MSEKVRFELRLDTISATRETFAQLIEEHGAGKVDRQLFRDLSAALNGFLAYLKLEAEIDVEDRLAELESRMTALHTLRRVK